MHRAGLLLVAFSIACGSAPSTTPATGPTANQIGVPDPVVLVPGVTGSKIRDPDTGRLLFGRLRQLVAPRDGGWALARPLSWHVERRAEPIGIIRSIGLPGLKKPIYQPLIQRLVDEGHRLGSAAQPSPDASLFLFAYDWRQDNVDSASRLVDLLTRVAAARPEPPSQMTLICQSNGSHICRYAAKYGGVPLDELAEVSASRPALPPLRLVLVGASNGGSLRILREMNRGRRYLPGVGRRFHPEVFFTMPSLFQDLPAGDGRVFIDEKGSPHPASLYRAEDWLRYGWSIFHPEAQVRIRRQGAETKFGDARSQQSYLEEALAQAQRFHRALLRDTPDTLVEDVYLVLNESQPTPIRAVLEERGGYWETVFEDEFGTAEPSWVDLLSATGDGHATLESQRTLSPQELARLRPSHKAVGEHFEMILEPDVLDYVARTASPGRAGRPRSTVRNR